MIQQIPQELLDLKSGSYYVNKVFPAFEIGDLRLDLIDRARQMTRSRTKDHNPEKPAYYNQ